MRIIPEMNKQLVRETLSTAVRNTHLHYPNFQGVVIFGSFATGNPKPSDLDLIPVLQKYGSCWYFKPQSEDDARDYHPDYDAYKQLEAFFASHFTEIAKGYEAVIKTRDSESWLIHIVSLVALDDISRLEEELLRLHTSPINFVGEEEARTKIEEHYQRKNRPILA